MLVPNRHASSAGYRYGYQGSEKDDEIKGEGNSYTTHFRMLDPRIGRWLSIDPEYKKLPWQSPYVAMDNNPIILNDPNGDCPQCLSGALVALFTETVAQIGANMFGLNESGRKMSFAEASSIDNLKGSDILSATVIGAGEGFFTGGTSKLVTFFAKKKNRFIAKLIVEKGIDLIFNMAENVLKNVLGDDSVTAESMKESFYGALIETGLGSLFSARVLKSYMKNQNVVISRMKKMINKAKKRGLEPKKKHIEALEKAEKNLRQTEVLNIPRDAAAEVGGNTGGAKVSEIIKDSEKGDKKGDKK